MTATPLMTGKPVADLSLSDGVTTLNFMLAPRNGQLALSHSNSPRTAMKITSGGGSYDDLEPPFSSKVQKDWSGGRGCRDIDTDEARFADSGYANTTRENEIRCGPLPVQGSGLYNAAYTSGAGTGTMNTALLNTTHTMDSTVAGVRCVRTTIVIENLPAAYISKDMRFYFSIADAVTPTTVYHSGYLPFQLQNGTFVLDFPVNLTLTSTVSYLFAISAVVDGATDYALADNIKFATVADAGMVFTFYDANGQVDYLNDLTLAFSLYTTTGYGQIQPFFYRGRMMAVKRSDDQAIPKLYLNGYHGIALSNATDSSKLKTSLDLTGVNLAGKIAMIMSGPGSTEDTNWRTIVSNTTTGSNDTITVVPNWNILHTPDASHKTEFVILGCDNWQEIASTAGASTSMAIKGLTTYLKAPVTDIQVVDDIIYFCQGEETALCRTRFNDGVWADADDDGGANMMTYLCLSQDENGKAWVWGAKAAAATVTESEKKAWGTDLAFDANPIVCKDTSSRITNLLPAKLSGAELPTVFKEDCFGAVSGTTTAKIFSPYRDYPEARDWYNGRAAALHDVYVMFSLAQGIERFYDQHLDDVGPNRDEGMPISRRGKAGVMVEYYSHLLVAYDGGSSGYSCILDWNGSGYHEIYRGPYGKRIRGMAIQSLPGFDFPARLWISVEEDIYYLPLSLNPEQQVGYKYQTGAYVQSSRFYASFKDIIKGWFKISLFTRNLTANINVTVQVRADGGAWVTLGTATTSPVQEFEIKSGGVYLTGRYLEYRLVLATNDTSVTPVVEAVRVDSVVRVPVKSVTQFAVLLTDDHPVDLNDQETHLSVAAQYNQLKTWQNSSSSPGPLTLGFRHALLDAMIGYIEGGSLTPLALPNDDQREMTAAVGFNFVEAE